MAKMEYKNNIYYKYDTAIEYIKYLENKVDVYEKELDVINDIRMLNFDEQALSVITSYEMITIPEKRLMINSSARDRAKDIVEDYYKS